MLGLAAVFGAGSIFLAKVMFQSRNDSVLQASSLLGQIVERSESAPGVDMLRKQTPCDVAAVINVADLRTLAQRLEDEEARKKKRVAKQIDTGTDPVVYCRPEKSVTPPSCEEVAKAFATTSPSTSFVVTVHDQVQEKCSERFDAKGASLGPAPTPNVPEL